VYKVLSLALVLMVVKESIADESVNGGKNECILDKHELRT
jgi:hypothetical protein